MRKLIYIITILFFTIMPVKAKEELVIEELQVNNGVITPKFDKYNNYYSITIDETTKVLEFNYKYNNDNFDVKITNNENLVNNKLVYVSIYDKETNEQNTYIFKIYIEETETTANIVEEQNIEETNNQKDTKNYAPIIGMICFILIIFVYYLFFLR